MTEIKKTQLDILRARREKLLAESEKTKMNIKVLEARVEKAKLESERRKKNRMKNNAGGIVDMTGLLRYVYVDESVRDNSQDDLIANLITGLLIRASSALEKSSVDELEKLWLEGRDFRKKDVKERELPELNRNITQMIDRVKNKLSINYAKTTKQPPNVDVQSDVQADVIES